MLPGSPAGFQYDQLPTGEDVARVRPCGSGCRGGVLSQRSIRLPPWFLLKAENMHPREVFPFKKKGHRDRDVKTIAKPTNISSATGVTGGHSIFTRKSCMSAVPVPSLQQS